MKILIFREKHCKRYFDASTKEAEARAHYSVLKARFEEGYWYPEPEEMFSRLSDIDEALLSLTEEQINRMFNKDDVRKRRDSIFRRETEKRSELDEYSWFYENLERLIQLPIEEAIMVQYTVAVRSNRPPLTRPLITVLAEERKDFEYEEFYTETLEKP